MRVYDLVQVATDTAECFAAIYFFFILSDRIRISKLVAMTLVIIYSALMFVLRPITGIFLKDIIRTVIIFVISIIISQNNLSYHVYLAGLAIFGLFTIQHLLEFVASLVTYHFWIGNYGEMYMFLDMRTHYILKVICAYTELLMVTGCRKWIKRMKETAYPLAIGLLSTISAFIISLLFNSIHLHNQEVITRVSILLAGLFIAATVVFAVTFSFEKSRLRATLVENSMLLRMNHAVREGYELIAERNEELRRQAHDFKNHLAALKEMEDDAKEAYIDELLTRDQNVLVSHTGDPFLDAVINSKLRQIGSIGIHYEQNISLPAPISISPSDLCAIVGNQMDNAIEACQKIENPDERWIQFSISQKGASAAIICANSIVKGSVTEESIHHSTKSSTNHMHGFGIQNIQICAERNHGVLIHVIEETQFISKVILSTTE